MRGGLNPVIVASMATIANFEQWIAEIEVAITVAEASGDVKEASALRARLPLLRLQRKRRLRTHEAAERSVASFADLVHCPVITGNGPS